MEKTTVLSKYLPTLTTRFPKFERILPLWERLTQQVLVNSFYVLGGTAVSAIAGFFFWFAAARLTDPAAVGITNVAIASSLLLSTIFDFGVNPTLLHYASANEAPTPIINASIFAGWGLIGLGVIGFLVGLPWWFPGMLPIHEDMVLVGLFFGFTMFNQILNLQDVAMLSQRRPQYLLSRNIACNVTPILLLFLFIRWFDGLPALMLAYMLPNILVGIGTSTLVLPKVIPGYRFFGQPNWTILQETWRYGFSNYKGNLLWGLPSYMIPILTINVLTAVETGYFVIAWTIVNALLIIPRAATMSLFAEGSRKPDELWSNARRVWLFIMGFGIPGVIVLWIWGDIGLSIFGGDYVNDMLLRVLLLSFIPFTFNSIYFVILRVQKRLISLQIFAATLCLTVLGGMWLLAPSLGAIGIGAGWLVGNMITLLVGVLLSLRFGLKRQWRLILSLFVMGYVLYAWFAPDIAYAQTYDLTPVTCVETANEVDPGWLRLNCDFEGDGEPNDRLEIFDRQFGSNGRLSWTDSGLQTDAIWLFDTDTNGQIELVIDFQPQGTALQAEIYTGKEILLSPNRQVIEPEGRPMIRMVVPDGWWAKDDLINFNFDMEIDGLTDAAFSITLPLEGVFITDRFTDIWVEVRDLDQDGRPEFDWRNLDYPEPEPLVAQTLPRSYLTVNVADNEPSLTPVFPWPHLGSITYLYLFMEAHPETPPPIQIDWETGDIAAVGEYVTSRGNDQQYFIQSSELLRPGERIVPNFENPFGWYDLAQDQDGQPELAVRFVLFGKNDPIFFGGLHDKPFSEIRYSWDQDNDDHWDYKLGLLGHYSTPETVEIANLEMAVLPYDDVPGWVMERPWGPTTFVAAENNNAVGEGVYEWDFPLWFQERYFWGASERPPYLFGEEREEIEMTYRGEYRINQDPVLPHLYFSPIDNRLHLKGAEFGVWEVITDTQVTYQDSDQNGYFDMWTYVDNSTPITKTIKLWHTPDYLLLSDGQSLSIKEAAIPSALWETLPPINHTEWSALADRLAEGKRGLPPDMGATLDQFAGETVVINHVSAEDFRALGDGGFRFVLETLPGFAPSDNALLSLPDDGRFVISSTDGFQVSPALTPEFSFDISLPEAVAMGDINVINVGVSHTGNVDAYDLTLVVLSRYDNQAWETVDIRSISTLVPEQIEPVLISIQPLVGGAYDLSFQLQNNAGNIFHEEIRSTTVNVANTGFGLISLLGEYSLNLWMILILSLLFIAILGWFTRDSA